jgi:hypothetical protein
MMGLMQSLERPVVVRIVTMVLWNPKKSRINNTTERENDGTQKKQTTQYAQNLLKESNSKSLQA